jgi:hypothetical protein
LTGGKPLAKRKKQTGVKTRTGQKNGSDRSAYEDQKTNPLKGVPYGGGKKKKDGGGRPYPDWRDKTHIEPPDHWQ